MRVCCLRNENFMWWIDIPEVRLLKGTIGLMHGSLSRWAFTVADMIRSRVTVWSQQLQPCLQTFYHQMTEAATMQDRVFRIPNS